MRIKKVVIWIKSKFKIKNFLKYVSERNSEC